MVFFLNLAAVGFLLFSCYTSFFVISPTHTLMPYLLPRLRSSILNCLLNTWMSITDITNITSRRPPFLSCILLEHTPYSCYPRHSDLIKALSFWLHLQKLKLFRPYPITITFSSPTPWLQTHQTTHLCPHFFGDLYTSVLWFTLFSLLRYPSQHLSYVAELKYQF